MSDNTHQDLRAIEQMLSEFNRESVQAAGTPLNKDSFLLAQDSQFLGKIIADKVDADSLLNTFGPYGSKYSLTSIFNEFSQYGGKSGFNSINNPFCNTPPRLYIKGAFVCHVTVNKYVPNQISSSLFLYLLHNDISALLNKNLNKKEEDIRQSNGESFLMAGDGIYLGKLTSDAYDIESVLNANEAYGSERSPKSIFNESGLYGNEASPLSPFNDSSFTPPKIYVRGEFYGYLTANVLVNGERLHPKELKEWIGENF